MSGDIVALVLGSSVLAGVLGAYLQSVKQREEAFRERMIAAALRFLSDETEAEKHLLSIGRDADVEDEAVEAENRAWTAVPLLAIVFPDDTVATAARQLMKVVENARERLVDADGDLPDDEEDRLFAEVERARRTFTGVTQKAIRKRAFRPLLGRGIPSGG